MLVVDDEYAVHEDFRRCLTHCARPSPELAALRNELFSTGQPPPTPSEEYLLDHAERGEDGADLASEALATGSPFALAFVDARMSPGWDGIETIRKLWELDPSMQMVLCTAYSDFSWERILEEVGRAGSLHLLRKPFEPEQVRRYADALCRKWQLARQRCTPKSRALHGRG